MPNKYKLLLIGTGDLPRRLLNKLNLDEWNIAGLRRSEIELPGVKMHFGDAANTEIVEPLLKQLPDQIILCLTPDSRKPPAYLKSYLEPARLVSGLAKKWAPSAHLIFVSSTSVFSQNSGQLIDETSVAEPDKETSQILIAAESEICSCGNPWSVVRFSGIYGPGRERLLEKIQAGEITPIEAASWTNRIHSEDCASILAHLLHRFNQSQQGNGMLIGTDSEPALNTDVEDWIARSLGHSGLSRTLSGRNTSPLNDASKFSGKRCSNKKLLASGFTLKYPDFRHGYQALIDQQ